MSTTNSEKVQVLTVLPKRWSVRKVQSECGASNYMVQKAKQLVKQKGILSTPNPRTGHGLAVETLDVVRRFYESDEVSRVMPGRKNFVSVRQAGGRVHIQEVGPQQLEGGLSVVQGDIPHYRHWLF